MVVISSIKTFITKTNVIKQNEIINNPELVLN